MGTSDTRQVKQAEETQESGYVDWSRTTKSEDYTGIKEKKI